MLLRSVATVILGLALSVGEASTPEEEERRHIVQVHQGTGTPEADVIEDHPGWFSLVRVRYQNGSRYEFVATEYCDPEERATIITQGVPRGAVFLGMRESETFGGDSDEWTFSWWLDE